MRQNYQKQMEAIVAALPIGARPRLLLHSCCGPCSSYVLEALTPYFDVTILFYNPNIQPESEYRLRLENQRKIIRLLPTMTPVNILECDYDGDAFLKAAVGLEREPEGGARCTVCFQLRLEQTAIQASTHGFDYFCTTLTVSPHKDAERLNQIGFEMQERYGVRFLPSDFKKRDGYKRSIQLSKEYQLYRQDYCGCFFSKTVDNDSDLL